MTTSGFEYGANPVYATSALSVPAGTPVIVNWPVASEIVDAPLGVSTTLAPCRAAPEESTTDPV